MSFLADRLTFANVVSVVALFVALGGSAYAVGVASVSSTEIKDGSVKSVDIQDGAVIGADVSEATLDIRNLISPRQVRSKLRKADGTGSRVDADFLDGRSAHEFLGAGDKAANADKLDGRDSSAFLGAADTAVNAEQLDGKDSAAFMQVVYSTTDVWDAPGLNPGECVVNQVPAPAGLQPTDNLIVSVNGSWAMATVLYGATTASNLNAIACNTGTAVVNNPETSVNYRVIR